MNGATKNDRLIRFSVFEVDLGSGELFKQGRKVKLQGQPFELLVALLERPGSNTNDGAKPAVAGARSGRNWPPAPPATPA